MRSEVEVELKAAVDRILESPSRRKLVVAGPGTGKTTLFRKLLESQPGDRTKRLVLTFVNNLKIDLERSLSELATVFTLHGYCQSLLHRHESIRDGLTDQFRCLPGMASLIKRDWEYLHNEPAPRFVELMRSLADSKDLDFYVERANYYDAVDFDDSVYRTFSELQKDPTHIDGHELVLIDEYQDFNRLENAFIELLAEHNPIVIAGDDDQALYSQLRGASWDHIRALFHRDDYEVFELPFCMRCPEVIVDAVNDIILKAREHEKLVGRIDKPYKHYEPVKGGDSQRYPRIASVTTTVQRLNANYFGRYIEKAIGDIPTEEIAEAIEKGDPPALVIGSRQYLRQIEAYLSERGFSIDTRQKSSELEREEGLAILSADPKANLGWRILLEFEKPQVAAQAIRAAAERTCALHEVIPGELKESILKEVGTWMAKAQEETEDDQKEEEAPGELTVKLTSFEGAKGLSAQHVFIVGLHEGDLPRDEKNIQDIEVCRFLVGLTRTKKKCTLMWTKSFAGRWMQPSLFLSWVKPERCERTLVDAKYWKT